MNTTRVNVYRTLLLRMFLGTSGCQYVTVYDYICV